MLIVKSQLEIAEEVGLIFDKINDDGQPEFIGTDKQFNEFKEICEEYERDAIDAEEAKEEGLREAREF